jgi:hypothetical protein
MEGFSVFGHKSLASTDTFIPTIESRAIIIHMRRNVRNLPVFLDKERAANLRFSLLVYRINVLQENISILENKNEILRYLPVKNGRLAELFYLLVSIAPTEEIRKRVSEFAIEVGNKRQEEEKTTIAAEIVEAVASCRDHVQNGKLMVETILETFNLGKADSLCLDSRSMGRELRKLGFDPTRVSGGRHAVFYNENLVNNLSLRFLSREMSQTSLTSLMSQGPSNDKGDVSDNSDDSDNSNGKKLTINDLNLVHATDEDLEEKVCGICSNKSKKSWVAMTIKGQIVYICENCAEDFKNQTSNQ